jgi:hypothetical protein
MRPHPQVVSADQLVAAVVSLGFEGALLSTTAAAADQAEDDQVAPQGPAPPHRDAVEPLAPELVITARSAVRTGDLLALPMDEGELSDVGEPQVLMSIRGMTCGSCVARVEGVLNAAPGVQSVAINCPGPLRALKRP